MTDYVLTSAQFALLAVALLLALRSAPARWRLWVSLAAVAGVILPWHWLPAIRVHQQIPVLPIEPLAAAMPVPVRLSGAAASQELPIVAILAVVAVFAMIVVVLSLKTRLSRWRALAAPYGPDVWVLPGSSVATSTWLGRAEIWIGDALLKDENVDAILAHERTHVALRHPQLAFALTVVRCLFFWHPLVWLFVAIARREIEFECDEACARAMGRARYQRALADLVRKLNPSSLGVSMARSRSLNVRRVRALARAKAAARRHVLAVAVAVASAVWVVMPVSAGSGSTSVASGEEGTYRVKLENVGLRQALISVAGVTQATFYVYPDHDFGQLDWEHPKAGGEELLSAFLEQLEIPSVRVGRSVVLLAPEQHINDPSWLSEAHVVTPFLGTPPQSAPGEPSGDAVMLNVVYEERQGAGDHARSEMGLLVSPGLSGVRTRGRHLSFVISDRTSESVVVEVSLFKVAADQSLKPVDSGLLNLRFEVADSLRWNADDGAEYVVGLTASEPSGSTSH